MNKVYIQSLKSKHRVRNFFLWYIPCVVIFSALLWGIITYWSIIPAAIIGLIANREKFLAATIKDDEIENELERYED